VKTQWYLLQAKVKTGKEKNKGFLKLWMPLVGFDFY